VGYSRELAGYSRPPEPLLDAWLLASFPGRTLEELDGMDWGRYTRALEAREAQRIEHKRARYLAQEVKELEPDEWAVVQEHDRLVTESE
jgi:hypothetical protein